MSEEQPTPEELAEARKQLLELIDEDEMEKLTAQAGGLAAAVRSFDEDEELSDE